MPTSFRRVRLGLIRRFFVVVGAVLACPAIAAGHADETASPTHPTTDLFLAGGALNICSGLATKHCAQSAHLAAGRTTSSYRIDAVGIALATDPLVWSKQPSERVEAVRVWLQMAARIEGKKTLDEGAVYDLFAKVCQRRTTSSACSPSPLWERLDDAERGAILSALEQPQLDSAGTRIREQVSLKHSRDLAGADILRAFVAAAAKRAGGVPKIGFVTASSFDSMDALDFYSEALRQAGAEPRWWPIDQAAAAVVFGDGDCAKLNSERARKLNIVGRERVYPDHAKTQAMWCQSADAAKFPDDLDGVFFAGGDQWRLQQALVDATGAPNAWMLGLRQAFSNGRIAVAGTSAGSAVQSALPMLGNGTSEHALRHLGKMRAPPSPGCTRSGSCGDVDEDSLTWWDAGGIGLAPFVVDTHFSERSREWRLLTLLAQSGARAGLGVDETSALHLQGQTDGSLRIQALGKSGGWLFSVVAQNCGQLRGQASYLAPQRDLQWRDGAVVWPSVAERQTSVGPERRLAADDGLLSAALRTAMQSLVPLDAGDLLFADERVSMRLARGANTAAFAGTRELRSVLGVEFELRWPQAGCQFRP